MCPTADQQGSAVVKGPGSAGAAAEAAIVCRAKAMAVEAISNSVVLTLEISSIRDKAMDMDISSRVEIGSKSKKQNHYLRITQMFYRFPSVHSEHFYDGRFPG